MSDESNLLEIDEKIVDLESDVKTIIFNKRLAKIALATCSPLILGGTIAGNCLIDFSHPGAGRIGLNLAGILLFTIPTLAALISWWGLRGDLHAKQNDLTKQHLRRRSLLRGPEQGPGGPRPFQEYRDAIPSLRDEYRQGAERYRKRHNTFQLTVIAGSILTSVATTAAAQQRELSWAAVSLSAIVSIAAGIIAYFKFRERSLNLQQTADSIDLELQAFALGIRRYRGLSSEEAAISFAEEIERLKEEQRKKELQLEQPPEASQQGGAQRQ
ncbi:DUF4231 domain-containing protein [Streptomyces luteireticuli]|uniref:DUF4231 domain-containing protein n=1 Tax=Streptomyces luteireticuli TaxID=173858 RepID=A0ABN0YNR2_9ACTN